MRWILLSATLVAGCSGADFDVRGADKTDVSDDADTASGDTITFDTDIPPKDSSSLDTGKPLGDSGTLPDSVPPDTGLPPVDTGPPDSGLPPIDTGSPPSDAPTSWTGVFPASSDTATLTDPPRMYTGGDNYTGTRDTGLAWISTVKGEIRLTTGTSGCPTTHEIMIGIKGTDGVWINAGPIKLSTGGTVIPYTFALPAAVPGPKVEFAYVSKGVAYPSTCSVVWTLNASPLTLK